MKWSKIRKNVQEYICDELQGVIDVQVTGYHKAHDGVGEAYITVNKQKIYGTGFYKGLMKGEGAIHKDYESLVFEDQQLLKSTREGNMDVGYISINLREYRNYSFDELFHSNNTILRAFMIVDRRLGKRKFSDIKIEEDESELVKIFYDLRKQVFNK